MSKFVKTDPQSHKGNSDTWLTPLDLIARIGKFDYDPCPFVGHQTASILEEGDGLKSKWFGKVWLNPPYSESKLWLDKLATHGLGVALIFARTGSSWIQKYIRASDEICLLRGRISFMRPDGTFGHNAGADSMLLCYGCSVDDKSLGVFVHPKRIA